MTEEFNAEDAKPEEKVDSYPKTEWVIPEREHKATDHEWEYDRYDGTLLNCTSCQRKHAVRVPIGKVATKKKGKWVIVDMAVLS
jgi:hypothetical protein